MTEDNSPGIYEPPNSREPPGREFHTSGNAGSGMAEETVKRAEHTILEGDSLTVNSCWKNGWDKVRKAKPPGAGNESRGRGGST